MLKEKEEKFKLYMFFTSLIAILVSLISSFYIRFSFIPAPKGRPDFKLYIPFILILSATHLFILYLQGYYKLKLKKNVLDDLFVISTNFIFSIFIVMAIFSYLRSYKFINYEISHLFLAVHVGVGVSLLFLSRLITYEYLKTLYKKGKNLQRAIIVGVNETAKKLSEKLKNYSSLGVEFVGFLSKNKEVNKEENIIGSVDKIDEVIKEYNIKDVFITDYINDYDILIKIITASNKNLASVRIVPDIIHFLSLKAEIEQIDDIPLINLSDTPLKGWRAVTKRVFDIFFSLFALALSIPIFIIVPILIKLQDGGDVFYLQERMGLDGKVFKMIKFRTMIPDAEKETGPVWTKKDDERITPVGKILRKFSIDEIPQFINVLLGDMSVVGPRPERPVFVERFREKFPQYMLRHKVKAGLTGWAQVHGLRGDTPLQERLKYDLYYIRNWSFTFDLKIILLTIMGFRFIDPNL